MNSYDFYRTVSYKHAPIIKQVGFDDRCTHPDFQKHHSRGAVIISEISPKKNPLFPEVIPPPSAIHLACPEGQWLSIFPLDEKPDGSPDVFAGGRCKLMIRLGLLPELREEEKETDMFWCRIDEKKMHDYLDEYAHIGVRLMDEDEGKVTPV